MTRYEARFPVGYLIQLAQGLPSAILSGMHNEVRSDLRVGRLNKRQCSNILLIAIPTSDIRSSEWPDLCSELLGFITLIVAFWLPRSLRAGLLSSYSA